MNPRRATTSSKRARSSRLGGSAVSRDGVRVSSAHDISHKACELCGCHNSGLDRLRAVRDEGEWGFWALSRQLNRVGNAGR